MQETGNACDTCANGCKKLEACVIRVRMEARGRKPVKQPTLIFLCLPSTISYLFRTAWSVLAMTDNLLRTYSNSLFQCERSCPYGRHWRAMCTSWNAISSSLLLYSGGGTKSNNASRRLCVLVRVLCVSPREDSFSLNANLFPFHPICVTILLN
jgi:hypothetical protein